VRVGVRRGRPGAGSNIRKRSMDGRWEELCRGSRTAEVIRSFTSPAAEKGVAPASAAGKTSLPSFSAGKSFVKNKKGVPRKVGVESLTQGCARKKTGQVTPRGTIRGVIRANCRRSNSTA